MFFFAVFVLVGNATIPKSSEETHLTIQNLLSIAVISSQKVFSQSPLVM